MNTRTIVALTLAAMLVVPAAGVAANTQSQSPVTDVDPALSQEDPDDTERNYTRLYVDDQYQNLRLQPGESETITITVENGEDEAVDLSPHLFVPPRGERPIDEEWVTIETDDLELDAGETREFNVTVDVPEDVAINRYGGAVALTDETISYPGRPAQPVNGVSLSVEVWQEPTVRVVSDTYVHSQVQAGDSFTREIVVENTGDEAVPVNPELATDDRYRPYDDRNTLDRSWVSFDAPNEIPAGEKATVAVTVSPPGDADRGDYRAEVDLGLKDPARSERSSHWQRVNVRFQVWTQPEEPFETSFDVSEDTEDVTLELAAGRYGAGSANADFDVTFVAPDGETIDAERVSVTNSGSVNLGETRRATTDDGTYASGGERQTFEYRLEDPDAGSWTVEIMPENAMQFSYDIVRNESG
jgi:hypothetical protein